MNAFKQQCLELRKKDHSLSEIMAITGRSKSSVYFHIENLPLSAKRKNDVRVAHAARLRKFSEQRKGKSKRSFETFNTWDVHTVSLVAHLLFDGEISKSACVYNNRSMALIAHVQKVMLYIYKFEPKPYLNQLTGVNRISYHNVALAAYIRNKGQQLLNEVVELPLPLRRAFLRAFFDDEGCMDFRPARNYRRVRGYQKKVATLYLVQKLLLDFGIKAAIALPNEVIITGKENLRAFQKEINFSPGVRINGNRPNSIWKESLEKREILDRAIASFKK